MPDIYICSQHGTSLIFLTDIFANFGGSGSFPGFSSAGRNSGFSTSRFTSEGAEFEDAPFAFHQKQDPPIMYDLLVTYEELLSGTKKKMKVMV